MKILCVIDSLGSGGAQRQLVGLAKGFKQKGHNVAFLVYHKIDFFKRELDEAGIQIHAVIEPNYLKRLFKMRRFIRSGNYDAVLSFLEASGFICEFAGLPFRRWRLVVGERSANPNIKKSFKKRFYRWFHLFADYVVANSRANIKLVRAINPLLAYHKCHVIYNMVDLGFWKPDLSKYKFRIEGNFNLVVVASHSFIKNLDGLVEAVALLSKEEQKVLKVSWFGSAGIDNSRQLAEKKIREYNLSAVFNFYEPTHDVISVIQQADAVGLFSFYEGLPNVICESLACGKPVIASAVSDLPVILRNNINGFLCNPNDVKSIAASLSNILKQSHEDLNAMGLKNRETAKRLFESSKIIDTYLSLFKQT